MKQFFLIINITKIVLYSIANNAAWYIGKLLKVNLEFSSQGNISFLLLFEVLSLNFILIISQLAKYNYPAIYLLKAEKQVSKWIC